MAQIKKDIVMKCREQIIAVFMSVSLGTDTLQYRKYIQLSNTDIPYLVNFFFFFFLFSFILILWHCRENAVKFGSENNDILILLASHSS